MNMMITKAIANLKLVLLEAELLIKVLNLLKSFLQHVKHTLILKNQATTSRKNPNLDK